MPDHETSPAPGPASDAQVWRCNARPGSAALGMLGVFATVAIVSLSPKMGVPFALALIAGIAAMLLLLFAEGVFSSAKHCERIRRLESDLSRDESINVAEGLAAALDRCSPSIRFAPRAAGERSPLALASIVLARNGLSGSVLMLAEDPSLLPPSTPLFEQTFEPMRLSEKDPAFRAFFQPVTATPWDKVKSEFRRSRPWARAGAAILIPIALVAMPISFVMWLIRTIGTWTANDVVNVCAYLAVFAALGLWSSRGTVEWYALPGGLLIRRAGLFSSRWRVSVIRRDESALVYFRDLETLAVGAADGRAFVGRLTEAEAQAGIRAFLSPLDPPSPDRLSDFQ